MNFRKLIVLTIISIYTFSCKDDDGDKAPAFIATFKVNSSDSKLTEATATDVGNFLDLSLKAADFELALHLDSAITGNYTMEDLILSTTSNAKGFSGVAILTSSTGQAYFSKSGTVNVIVKDGKATGSYNVKTTPVTNGTDTWAAEGTFENLVIKNQNEAGCLLTSLNPTPDFISTLRYDAKGNLTTLTTITSNGGNFNGARYHAYFGNKMMFIYNYYNFRTTYKPEYEGEKLTKLTWSKADGELISARTYTYDGSGKLTKIGYGASGDDECLTYTGENITRDYTCDNPNFGDIKLSLFDTKNNPGKLLLKGFQNYSPLMLTSFGVPAYLAANNPGKVEYLPDGQKYRYEYSYPQYNSAGYPVKITEDYYPDLVSTAGKTTKFFSYAYKNCN